MGPLQLFLFYVKTAHATIKLVIQVTEEGLGNYSPGFFLILYKNECAICGCFRIVGSLWWFKLVLSTNLAASKHTIWNSVMDNIWSPVAGGTSFFIDLMSDSK